MRYILLILFLCSNVFAENPYKILNNFNGGELSPYLNSREDLAKFQSGCSIMENFFPLPQGGAQKRPGTKYIAEVKNSSLATRLLPFEFSTSQAYIVELGNQYMRFFTDSDIVYTQWGSEDLSAIGGIVAHWKCNDNAATTAVVDADGATHNGVATSNTSTMTSSDASSSANEAFDLDGDTITISHHGDFSFGDGTDDSVFSIAAWINVPTNPATTQTIIAKATSANVGEWESHIASDDTIHFTMTDASEPAYIVTRTTDAITTGWHFIVITYDGRGGSLANRGVKIYIDNVIAKVAYSGSGVYVAMEVNAALDVIIGSLSAGNLKFQDKIDNVAIFNKELTAVEVASLVGGTTTTPSEIITPYLTADLFNLKYEQSADVLYITHPDYETRKLSRLSNSIWSLEVAGIENGPFRTQNSDVIKTITASATTGSVTLTASGHSPFITGSTSGHIPSGSVFTSKSQTGALFRLIHPLSTLEYKEELESDFAAGQVENASWVDCGILYKGTTWTLVSGDTWFGTIKVQRNYTLGAAVGNGADEGASLGWETVFTYSSGAGAGVDARNVSTTGEEEDAAAQYRVIYADEIGDDTVSVYLSTDQTEHIGVVEITAVASGTSATATVLETLASTDATHKWSEGSWSNYRGWPQTVTFFEDRLCFGGNTGQPDTIWGSVTSDYENMKAGANDDDAVAFTLSSRQVNVIEWLVGKDKLLIGTSGAEWTISGGTDEPLSPSNVLAKQHSTYGSANLQATMANESVLFFQRGKEKMRELAYNWEIDSYVAPDMTILSNLVTDSGIDDTAFQKTPDSILWCIRNDGELPVFSYERNENITAWSRMVTQTNIAGTLTDSDFESIVSIHGDSEDEIWAIVERTINSSTVRYIEQFQPRDFGNDSEDAFYVDCGVTYDSTASSSITGLTHLEGQTVQVLADGVVFDTAVVSGGEITLKSGGVTTTASTVQIGLCYEAHLRTMPLSWLGDTTVHGRQKRISEVIAEWYVSGDFSIGKDVDDLQTYSISGQTTFLDRKTFPPGWDRNGYIYIYQNSPEPLTILSIMAEFNLR